MEGPLPIHPEELLSHAHWMRSLARSLVNDAASADDVVQEALVVALRRPPDSSRPLHAWLSRVVRNVASNSRRGEERAADRHARRGLAEPALDPAATLERLDTQRLIVDLVRELDEPARSTIVLHYFEGLTSAEIGLRMGVSDATVRWRLQKALDELRARLQRKYGSREAWCAVLVPLAHSLPAATTTTAAASLTTGIGFMGTIAKLAAVAVAVAVLGAGWWVARDREASGTERALAAAPQPAEVQENLEPAAQEVTERAALVAEVDPVPTIGGNPTPAAEPESVGPNAHVRARFVDTAGKPWEGVLFRVGDSSYGFQSSNDVTSGREGQIELEFTVPAEHREPNVELVATRTGCATRSMHVALIVGSVVDLGAIVLEREAIVRGTVRDGRGAGRGDVTVGLSPVDFSSQSPGQLRRGGSYDFERLVVTSSDSRGVFELTAVAPGKWRVWGHGEGLGYGVSEPFEVLAGEEEVDVDFDVPDLIATDTIQGIVLDVSGDPASKAVVSFAWELGHVSGGTACQSASDGTFTLLLNGEVSGEVRAEDKDRGLSSATQRDVAPGARDVVLQFAERKAASKVRLRVHGPAGEPVSAVKLVVNVEQSNGHFMGPHMIPTEVEAGLFEFPLPERVFWLKIAAKGYIDGISEDLDPSSIPSEVEIGLEVAPMLRGRVVAAGSPVPSALLQGLPSVPPGRHSTVDGFPSLVGRHPAVNAVAATDGTFALALQGTAPVYVRCVAPGFASTTVGPVVVDGTSPPLEIDLTVGGSLEGRVRAQDGTTVAGAIVGITCGDGYPRTMRSGLDGAFRFDGLSVGNWLVMEAKEEVTNSNSTSTGLGDRPIEWSCHVAAGGTTHFDLLLAR